MPLARGFSDSYSTLLVAVGRDSVPPHAFATHGDSQFVVSTIHDQWVAFSAPSRQSAAFAATTRTLFLYIALGAGAAAQAQIGAVGAALTPDQRLARDIFAELMGINTAHESARACTDQLDESMDRCAEYRRSATCRSPGHGSRQ